MCSLEAKKPERVPAGVKPARGVRAGAVLLRIQPLLSLLQAAAGRTLQAAALQTGECCDATSWGGGGVSAASHCGRNCYLSVWGSVSPLNKCSVGSCRGRLVNESNLVLK